MFALVGLSPSTLSNGNTELITSSTRPILITECEGGASQISYMTCIVKATSYGIDSICLPCGFLGTSNSFVFTRA